MIMTNLLHQIWPAEKWQNLLKFHFHNSMLAKLLELLLNIAQRKQFVFDNIISDRLLQVCISLNMNLHVKTNIIARKPVFGVEMKSPKPNTSSLAWTYSLKLEITVYFFWLSLPVHSGSLKRIDYQNSCLVHPLSFECLYCS